MTSIAVRTLEWPNDLAPLERLDIGILTNTVLDVRQEPRGFSLVERSVAPPLRKKYSVDWRELEAASAAIVAEIDRAIVGVASLVFQAWNRRAVVSHLYVDAAARGHGVGSRLLQELLTHANVFGAGSLFVETQNVNPLAIRFYERNGLRLVGLDTSFYDGSDGAGETALFFAMPLDPRRS